MVDISTAKMRVLLVFVSSMLFAFAASGVEVVKNGAEPAEGIHTLHLEEVWCTGGEDDEILMGVISGVLAGPDGEVILLDHQLCQVLVYSADGEYLRTLSREGDGPGEIRMPRQVLWTDEGVLGFLHRAPGLVTRIDTEGIPLQSFTLKTEDGGVPGRIQLNRAHFGDGFVVANGSQWKNEDGDRQQYNFLGIFDESGIPRRRLMTETSGFSFVDRSYDETNDNTRGTTCWTVDQEGFIYFTPQRDRYEIAVLDSDGTRVRTIERDYDRLRRTAEMKANQANGYSMNINGENVQMTTRFLDYDQVLSRLRIDERGWLLVRHSRSQMDLPDDILETWDVFDRDGHFRHVLQITADMNKDQDRLLPLADGRFVLLRNIFDAQTSMWAAFADEEEDDDLAESEPLEIVLLRAVER